MIPRQSIRTAPVPPLGAGGGGGGGGGAEAQAAAASTAVSATGLIMARSLSDAEERDCKH
ncbi:hypothetical protein GCM10017620_20670 [Brevundimonas intermedia]|uniref:Uncharacterized protein n=1 Tax=Brevundimonas intermedia TaxID=74315 RepID=A0ABQ5TAK5_9CAUL|nr:hypothetical protein GCM10017620_20670 [Brevundimonas intermedia]